MSMFKPRKAGRDGMFNPPSPAQPPPQTPPPERPAEQDEARAEAKPQETPRKPYRQPVGGGVEREIRSFTQSLAIRPLESTAQALWMHLLDIWCQEGHPEWFEVANATLFGRLGVSDKPLIKHRMLLIEAGLIEYEGKARSKGGRYRFNALAPDGDSSGKTSGESTGDIPPDTTSGETAGDSDGEMTVNAKSTGDSYGESAGENPPVVFLQEVKRDREIDREIEGGTVFMDRLNTEVDRTAWAYFVDTFRKTFGKLEAHHADMVGSYLDDGMELAVVNMALEDAQNNGAETPKYLWTILVDLMANKVRTVRDYTQFMAARAEMRAGQQQTSAGKGGSYRATRGANGKGATPNNVVSISEGKTGWLGKSEAL